MNGWFCLRIWTGFILALFLIVSVFATVAGAVTWTHSVTGGYDVWYLNGTQQKFRYNLANHQWSDFSTIGSSWQILSSTGRSNTFIGDGHWRDLGNGFSYQYSAASDQGKFEDGAAQRFMYKYAPGQWYHSADTLSWQALGKAGLNATFVGDGHWRDLGNGFSYWYSAAYDQGRFKDGACQRFLYKYAPGQWYHSADTHSFQVLGKAGLNAGLLGDGHWRDLGNGFTYQYSLGYDKGTFKDGPVCRFLYKYGPGQWYDSADTLSWQPLGKAGLNATFIGDGARHPIGAGWNFRYDGRYSYWYRADNSLLRFYYDHLNDDWYHVDGLAGASDSLSKLSLFSSPVWNALNGQIMKGNFVWFSYMYASDELALFWYNEGGTGLKYEVMKYSYANHRWYDRRIDKTNVATYPWCLVPSDGTPQLLKHFWIDMDETITNGRTMQAWLWWGFGSPIIWMNDSSENIWIYYYDTGIWHRNSVVWATNVGPDYCR